MSEPRNFKGQQRRVSRGAILPLVLLGLIQLAPSKLDDGAPAATSTSRHNQRDYLIVSAAAGRSQYPSVISNEHNPTTTSSSFPSEVSRSGENSRLAPSIVSSTLSYLSSAHDSLSKLSFGPKIIVAHAHAPHTPELSKEIFNLTASNFNSELIQYESPFPHIKLIEYYVAFCGYCEKFRATFSQLTNEIHPWRNVIRTAGIDLAYNKLIGPLWSINVVPTLKIHPPVNLTTAKRFHHQLQEWQKTLSPEVIHRNMAASFNGLDIYKNNSLDLVRYLDNAKLLKYDLLEYVERLVRSHPGELPATWPNLRPVTESSLTELRNAHPRKEMFLIVEGSSSRQSSSSDQSSAGPVSLGLSAVMDLSSTSAWKSVRYVRASENRALIENVIMQLKKVSERQQQDSQHEEKSKQLNGNSIQDQIEALTDLMMQDGARQVDSKSNSMVLIHIDDSHAPLKRTETIATAIPSMTIVTGSDLVSGDQAAGLSSGDATSGTVNTNIITRARRAASSEINSIDVTSPVIKFNSLSNEKKIELMISHIKQIYTETTEDALFMKAINSFDKDITIRGDENQLVKKFSSETKKSALHRLKQSVAHPVSKSLPEVLESFNPHRLLSQTDQDEYEDKIKAIRYILFNEVPRKLLSSRTQAEKQEKLATLSNLVSVFKSYFPLPDSSSIHFIDGVQNYLNNQKLLAKSSNESLISQVLDPKMYKEELRRLEAEGKQLPETPEWKACKAPISGYPCALWRLFHTLTAFEYRKLSQIYHIESNQIQVLPSQHPALSSASEPSVPHQAISQPDPLARLRPSPSESDRSNNNIDASNRQGSPEAEPISSANSQPNDMTAQVQPNQNPVERLVSPPSTTTSLSLTIVAPSSSNSSSNDKTTIGRRGRPLSSELADLPMPVLLVMRDYITNFFSCEECVKNFRIEAGDLTLDKIRQQEPPEFSILWLWETHNRVNKRLSVDSATNPKDHPKVWFPTYEQCSACYIRAPSFMNDNYKGVHTVEPREMFREAIEWNRQEVMHFLMREYTKQPMDNVTNIFGYQVPYGFGYILVTCVSCLLLISLLRLASCYIERQRRHKATLLNGNGAHYTMELQGS